MPAGQIVSAINLPSALDVGKARHSLVSESGSLCGSGVEPTTNSTPQSSGQTPRLQVAVALEKTSPLQLEDGLALQVPGKTARMAGQPSSQAEPAAIPPQSADVADLQSRTGSAGEGNSAAVATQAVLTDLRTPQKAATSPQGHPPSVVPPKTSGGMDVLPTAPESSAPPHEGTTSIEGSHPARRIDRKEPKPFLEVPPPSQNRAEIGTEPESRRADAATPALVHLGVTPPARPRPQEPEIAVPATGVTDRSLTAPVAPPCANTVPSDSSTSPAPRTQPPATSPARRSSGSVVAQVLSLSGQMPRGIESPPAESGVSKKAAPSASIAESRSPADSAQVRGLSAVTPDVGEVAFVVRTMAVPAEVKIACGANRTRISRPPKGQRGFPFRRKSATFAAPEPSAASENRPSPFGGAETRRHPVRGVSAGWRQRQLSGPRLTPRSPPERQFRLRAPDAPMKAESSPEHPEAAEAKPVSPKDALEIRD